MRVSIVIATRNRVTHIAETLASLNYLKIPQGIEAELIVVDNGSTDGTAALLASIAPGNFLLKTLFHPQTGKSGALNAALSLGTGDVFVMTDDDVRPEVSWLENLIFPIANGKADAVAGTVRIAPHLLRPWMTALHRAWLASTEFLDFASPKTAIGANMAFSRAVLSRVPGFDPALGPGQRGLWEDTLFSLQLREAGFRLVGAPDAVVVHHFEPSRLSRSSFLAHARREAHSSAYVAWHWQHEKRSSRLLRCAEYRLRLFAKHLLHPLEWRRVEGVTEWEMNFVTGIEFERQYSIERCAVPAYELRGLVKGSV